jgi:divalent metal cation (Fe/Co/Zn/Cd) transporter
MSESKDIKDAKQRFEEVFGHINTALHNLNLAKQRLMDLHEKIHEKIHAKISDEENTQQIHEINQIIIWSNKYIHVSLNTIEDMRNHIESTADDLNRI